jgi:hypothetical protein
VIGKANVFGRGNRFPSMTWAKLLFAAGEKDGSTIMERNPDASWNL